MRRTAEIFPETPWMPTASGIAFDLRNPTPAMVNFGDIATALAQIARYSGNTPAGPYSVAQHCVAGCDYLLPKAGKEAALYFLLHDAHETAVGDMTSPTRRELDHLTGDALGRALDELKRKIDLAVWSAAGLPPPSETIEDLIRAMDLAIAKVEIRLLVAPCARPFRKDVEQSAGLAMRAKSFRLMSWADAREEWLDRLRKLCPDLNPRHR